MSASAGRRCTPPSWPTYSPSIACATSVLQVTVPLCASASPACSTLTCSPVWSTWSRSCDTVATIAACRCGGAIRSAVVSSPDCASPAASHPRRSSASLYLPQNYGAQRPLGSELAAARRRAAAARRCEPVDRHRRRPRRVPQRWASVLGAPRAPQQGTEIGSAPHRLLLSER